MWIRESQGGWEVSLSGCGPQNLISDSHSKDGLDWWEDLFLVFCVIGLTSFLKLFVMKYIFIIYVFKVYNVF